MTHAHPDHVNGLPYVVGDDIPVYATAGVTQTVAQVTDPKRAQWQPLYGDEWPDRFQVPDHPLPGGGAVDVDGLRIEVRDLGAAESHADSYLLVHAGARRVAFIGDVAFDGVHAYTADGHTGQWLDALDQLTGDLDDVPLYPDRRAEA